MFDCWNFAFVCSLANMITFSVVFYCGIITKHNNNGISSWANFSYAVLGFDFFFSVLCRSEASTDEASSNPQLSTLNH